jgi:acyl carrier protein
MVTAKEVRRTVLAEIERAAGRPVGPDDELAADLGLDSITLTQLAVELEDRFLLRLSGLAAEPPRTVDDVVRLGARRLDVEP